MKLQKYAIQWVERWCNQPSIFKKMSFREFAESHPPHYAKHLNMMNKLPKHIKGRKNKLEANVYDNTQRNTWWSRP